MQIKEYGAPWSTTSQTTERSHSILKGSVHSGSTSGQEASIIRHTTFSLKGPTCKKPKVLMKRASF